MEEESGSEESIFETNLWYGVHYPASEIPNVVAALAGTQFGALSTDERELTINKRKYLRNVNSDFTETRGVIFSDEMSVQGEESETPSTYCKFDPTLLSKSEETFEDCVSTLTDIYDIIVAYYKRSNLPLKSLYFGWAAYNCEWADGDSDEDSPVVAKAAAPKAGGGKKPNNKNAPVKKANNKKAPAKKK